ncbi:MAG: hypothetical protein D6748_07250 [Calditrichaeota bacterium]|nr:MAG: hypothetical protein D6748_07250 [Calditrichota bacterium]
MRRLLLLFINIFVASTLAQPTLPSKKIYHATPVNPHPPVIDGRLNDPVWENIPWVGDFIQLEPHDGAPPTQPTHFKITYDKKNLYILIRAVDREPDKIVKRVARRDEGDDADMVSVLIDSYFDHLTAFEFAVNAAGVRIDAIWSDNGDNRDTNWDPVWYVHTTVDDSGWTAEMRIPFSQLRFGKKSEQVWGLQVGRYLYRKQEWSLWQPIPKEASGFISRIGELHGIHQIDIPRRIELLPYSVGSTRFFESEEGNPFADGRDSKLTAGLDGKIGITSDLTLDFTINPDFGQVEADPSEVNLTAFETFFEEKRPFFIEGQNIFNYRLAFGGGPFSRETLFYSRRIGRSPQYEPDLNDDEYADMPENTSIISAAKLTGKTSGGLSIGILEALTARESAEIDFRGQRRKVTIEPFTSYFVSRFQKDFRQGNTTLGGMMTAVNRDINESHLNFLPRDVYTGGLDFSHQWKNREYFLSVKTAFSHLRGDREAILETQTAAQRYFQRPDVTHVRVDSNRTSLSGHGGTFSIGKIGGGHWRYALGGIWRSPGFETNDLGFLRRADIGMNYLWLSYQEWEPKHFYREWRVNFNLWTGWDFGGNRLFRGGNLNGGGQFKNYWSLWLGVEREGESLSANELRGGPMLKLPGSWNFWVNLSSDERKSLELGIGASNNWNDDGISHRNNVWLEFSWRPDDALQLAINPFYSFNKDNLQYVTTETNSSQNTERYIFARLKQQTVGLVFRANFSLTPNLSIQYYGQPFISAGTYSLFKRITHPRATRYEDRFATYHEDELQLDLEDEVYRVDENRDGIIDYTFDLPDFNFQEFRSNLVVRWEYLPGSTLFLVWSQDRNDFISNGRFSAGDDLRNLFDTHPDNIFLIKLNYWFSM